MLDAGLPLPAHGVFTTRAGGVSLPPWESLNLAVHVEDAFAKVQRNRELVVARLGLDGLAFGKQVHGSGVRVVRGLSKKTSRGLDDTDGLVTSVPGIGLAMMAAHCLPVLLAADGVVGAAHEGRPGLAKAVLPEVVRVMRDEGARDITAVIGPGICGRCYEVPPSMAGEVEKAVPGSRSTTRQGTASVDLTAGATRQLEQQGVTVSVVGGCTLEQPDLFFSYRRDGLTGRHAGIVWLR
ncbi:MAG: purine-nucleoside/S-methyl-5-thioadenosine phosphorylase / adenosine deaminase [Frankiales bacterium]|nr:purine-nucleoside/S-methyl-5-thioadenosine phosphorylase / adenosine deaminase [Frankiales bacterium]